MATFLRLPPYLRHTTFAVTSPQLHTILQYARFSTSGSAPPRTYSEALSLLEALQSNKSIRSSISSPSRYDKNLTAIPEMLEWTQRAGYQPADFAQAGLKFIHVAGTKGKGSVCALVEGILMGYQNDADGRDKRGGRRRGEKGGQMEEGIGKIGTYTSPHLTTVRERIRINGAPLSEALFTQYFFELWDRLASSRSISSTSDSEKPSYFRYLTLLALHTFVRENIESAVVECGIGGEYDSTNILPPEAVTVTGITTLGTDHVGMLGENIGSIAWHKAGIMKHGVPAFTSPQTPEAQKVLQDRATEKGVKLSIVDHLLVLESPNIKPHLTHSGPFHLLNTSLALTIACTHLSALGISNIPPTRSFRSSSPSDDPPYLTPRLINALKTTPPLPGRYTIIRESPFLEWYIDGAHTVDSIRATAHWFRDIVRSSREKERILTVLVFNQQDGGRDAGVLLRTVLDEMRGKVSVNPERDNRGLVGTSREEMASASQTFHYAVFCANKAFKEGTEGNEGEKKERGIDSKPQEQVAALYKSLSGNLSSGDSSSEVLGSVEEAVELARRMAGNIGGEVDGKRNGKKEKVMVLVTGSLHLVGGLLQVLQRDGIDVGIEKG